MTRADNHSKDRSANADDSIFYGHEKAPNLDYAIHAETARCITFASHQSDVALIADLQITNNSKNALEAVTVRMTCDPPVVAHRTWTLDHIAAESEFKLRDRRVSLAGGMLNELTESVRAELTFELLHGDDIIAQSQHPLLALARNEWGGASHMPELLAAFVMPNDSAVGHILKEASGILERSNRKSSMEGYQTKSRKRSWEIASGIWAAVAARRLTYANPPASFEYEGQKIRFPSVIAEQGLATCLDSALLFASSLEQAGLYPIIVFTEGHAFTGVWLQPQSLQALTVEDPMEIRKAIAQEELIVFETTLATGADSMPFSKAIAQGTRQLSEAHENEFIYAIDIRQARARGIQPLSGSIQVARSAASSTDEEPVAAALDAAPDLPPFEDSLPEQDLGQATPTERLDAWKRSLLDLSKRNRLLNLKTSNTTIPIFCPDPAQLEDMIAEGKRIRIITPPERRGAADQSDTELRLLRTGEDAAEAFAAEALGRHEIVANIDAKRLEKGAIELYRKAKADFEEGGSNTLFLALGMLRWSPTGDSKYSYRAPLILLPVTIERASAASQPYLRSHEDEPVFNLTLLEMLRQDFQLDIPGLEGELIADESGIDVPRIWNLVRSKVRDVPGFEVVEDVVLSTFSFAKYLMWKDLSDRTEVLKQAPFVEHVIDHAREPYAHGASFIEPREIDRKIDPSELLAPLNADSSQIVAIHASTTDGDFVLEGPPGTGKSETIANIIAHNIGRGRRVLFVSEKMAALDVVYRRLSAAGLGDFCLELHSAKANKRAVLDQLGSAWDRRGNTVVQQWQDKTNQLGALRSDLNQLVDALHAPGPAGLSPRAAIGRLMRFADIHRMRLDWPRDTSAAGYAPSPDALERLELTAKRLGQQFAELSAEDPDIFADIAHDDWSNAWAGELVSSARTLNQSIERVAHCRDAFTDKLGIAAAGDDPQETAALASIAALFAAGRQRDLAFSLAPEGRDTLASLQFLYDKLAAYGEVRQKLTTSVEDGRIPGQPFERWIAEANEAESRRWPMRFFACRRLRKVLRTELGLAKTKGAQPEKNLPVLLELSKLRQDMDTAAERLAAGTPWQGLDTDRSALEEAIKHGHALREAVLRLANFERDLIETRQQIRQLFGDGRDLLEPGMPIAQIGQDLIQAHAAFDQRHLEYSSLARDDSQRVRDSLAHLAQSTHQIAEHERRLNTWCQWINVRRRANEQGLGVLVEALENGSVKAYTTVEALHTAYAAWIAPILIDERPALRRFSSVRHEDLIRTFRDLDKEVAALSARFIHAKLSGDIPTRDGSKSTPGYGVLARELQKKSRHKPVRQLVSEMGDALMTLTPCLMMSPLSVAQFLPAETQAFDLVVFDEASQITVPDAIGAIARGKRCIIVGDPHQMPPTNFFSRGAGDGDDSDGVQDLESILDEALAARLPHHRLKGHYRSRHESLITFSNHKYYGGDLVTYPSAETADSAVSLRRVEGIYAKGKTRTNEIEAKTLVQEILARLRDPQRNHLSIGVVTLNSEQQHLIEDLLDQERRADPELESFFGAEHPDPVFVKNLETVQGDQRDVILLSIAYGPTEPGAQTMSMNFGPLNKKGGERRLNVAITRATTEVVVFASFDAGMIDLTRTSSFAIRDLKHYLEFAERGPTAIGAAVQSEGGKHDYDSDFEMAVAERLRAAGWTVRTQVGVSKFRVDLGIVHPEMPGTFLAGVECDGATYHSSPSARDRDRVRHIILENLGWRLLRIWSTDFFQDPDAVMVRINRQLSDTLAADRVKAETQRADQSVNHEEDFSNRPENDARDTAAASDNLPSKSTEAVETVDPHDSNIHESPTAREPQTNEPITKTQNNHVAGTSSDANRSTDAAATALKALQPERFHENYYQKTLRVLAVDLVDQEGPITFKRISDHIARAHGFQRTGRQIRQSVWQAINKQRQQSRAPDQHTIFWPEHLEPQTVFTFRGLAVGDRTREWREVPYPEKMGLIEDLIQSGTSRDILSRSVAERIGTGRVTATLTREIESLVNEWDARQSPHD